MTITGFVNFLFAKPEDRRDLLESFLNPEKNDRQSTMITNRLYYDGLHWQIEEDGLANTTTSGKLIWGRVERNVQPATGKGSSMRARARGRGNVIAFPDGQLQTINFIKLFAQVYQDYVTGNSEEDVSVTWEGIKGEEVEESELEAANKDLGAFWEDTDSFIKTQITRGIVNTVMIAKIDYQQPLKEGEKAISGDATRATQILGEFSVSSADPLELFPIYEGEKVVGWVRAHFISIGEAKVFGDRFGVSINKGKDKETTFAEAWYISPVDGHFYYVRFIQGKIVMEGGEPLRLEDELAFLPYEMVPNIDHAYRRFDDFTLEDSEIFNWIDKNDAINSNETIAFITNQYLAMPKVTIDIEAADKLNVDINSASFRQLLEKFQYFGGSIDSLPIKLIQGHTVPDSFYTNLERIKSGLFEDAGIPEFLISGHGMANVSEETMRIGLTMLIRKITQKREQIEKLVIAMTRNCLRLKGYIDEEVKDKDILIEVHFPDLMQLTKLETIDHILESFRDGLYPSDYARRRLLEITGRIEDLDEVKQLAQNDLLSIRDEIDTAKTAVQDDRLAEVQVRRGEEQKRQLAEVTERIDTINGT